MIRRLPAMLALPLALAIAACGGDRPAAESNVDTLDQELAAAGSGNGTDPALLGALQDQIMVDPTLTAQANRDSVSPPAQPYSAAVPQDGVASGATRDAGALDKAPEATHDCPQCTVAREAVTLGALAARQTSRGTANCARALRYAASWANRLPADVPLYPGARVVEAAGANANGCSLRAVTFSVGAPLQKTIDWYYTRTTKAGFKSGHQSDGEQHILAGTRANDEGAYVLFLTERADGGTDVDLIANNGA